MVGRKCHRELLKDFFLLFLLRKIEVEWIYFNFFIICVLSSRRANFFVFFYFLPFARPSELLSLTGFSPFLSAVDEYYGEIMKNTQQTSWDGR